MGRSGTTPNRRRGLAGRSWIGPSLLKCEHERMNNDTEHGAKRSRLLRAAVAVAVIILGAGCSSGHDATVIGGSFQFTSPGGKTEFAYPPGQRGTINELSGPKVGGGTVGLSDFSGHIVVVNLWGAWCPACRAETDDLLVAEKILRPRGIEFMGLDVKDNPGAGAAFQQESHIPYPSIEDPGMRTLLSLRGYPSGAIPSTFVLDRDHRVAHIWLGPVNASQLVETIKTLDTAATVPTNNR